MWADTNQAIFYVENEQVAVADNYIASTSIYHQQISGRVAHVQQSAKWPVRNCDYLMSTYDRAHQYIRI